MPKPNAKQLTVAGLLACGWTLDTTARAKHYDVYRHDLYGRRWLIGHSGALRWVAPGEPISASRSMTGTNYHHALQVVGSRAKGYTTAEQARADLEHLASTRCVPPA